ncbi:hypothetical protein Pla108_35360 [Botrimarina colliarenosi]|uniref:DUF1580 domain-containing protein n=1 Tax=Botrimarina colliarenosi TaxID=2528001 RepID=A0A5C6A7W7_9BACT|nr:DUF1580 domain-containing protein [Botrimarina colliarenosi]TWT95388.1 hypothetical protein Pla108_35360 [Botrimarina colliarenosi]
MINLQTEKLVPLGDVPRYLDARGGKRVHLSTIYRWATKGSRGRVLETQLLGGARYTSVAALERFFQGAGSPSGDNGADALRRALYGETA